MKITKRVRRCLALFAFPILALSLTGCGIAHKQQANQNQPTKQQVRILKHVRHQINKSTPDQLVHDEAKADKQVAYNITYAPSWNKHTGYIHVKTNLVKADKAVKGQYATKKQKMMLAVTARNVATQQNIMQSKLHDRKFHFVYVAPNGQEL